MIVFSLELECLNIKTKTKKDLDVTSVMSYKETNVCWSEWHGLRSLKYEVSSSSLMWMEKIHLKELSLIRLDRS